MNTKNYPFGGIFCRVVEEGEKALSSILAVPLCPTEQAMIRSFFTLPPEGLPLFVNRCSRIAHMQVEGGVMNEEELDACRTWHASLSR